MPAPQEFSVVRELARREVERHQKRWYGITASAPQFVDQNGLTEWVVDVRVGVKEGWALVRECPISQWALGVVNDLNVPVTLERSEAGQLTVIARSVVRAPNVVLDTYTYNDLGRVFMANLVESTDGWTDGYGHAVIDPTTQTGVSARWRWQQDMVEWGSTDFEYGTTELEEVDAGWVEESIARPS